MWTVYREAWHHYLFDKTRYYDKTGSLYFSVTVYIHMCLHIMGIDTYLQHVLKHVFDSEA